MPGMCMDVDGNPGVRDGANVQLWSCEKSTPQTSDQIWDIMDNGHIVNRPSGKCLDLVGMCNKMGLTGIKINTCEDKGYRNFWGQTDHFWRKRYHDSTYFRIENICTGKCADVSGWSDAENGKTIHQFECEEWGDFKMRGGGWGKKKEKKSTDHWWKFVPVDLQKITYLQWKRKKKCSCVRLSYSSYFHKISKYTLFLYKLELLIDFLKNVKKKTG